MRNYERIRRMLAEGRYDDRDPLKLRSANFSRDVTEGVNAGEITREQEYDLWKRYIELLRLRPAAPPPA